MLQHIVLHGLPILVNHHIQILLSYYNKELYKYFKHNRRIVDIKDYNPEHSEIYSREILNKIAKQEKGWENQLPDGVAEMIKERGMFGYKEDIEFEEY